MAESIRPEKTGRLYADTGLKWFASVATILAKETTEHVGQALLEKETLGSMALGGVAAYFGVPVQEAAAFAGGFRASLEFLERRDEMPIGEKVWRAASRGIGTATIVYVVGQGMHNIPEMPQMVQVASNMASNQLNEGIIHLQQWFGQMWEAAKTFATPQSFPVQEVPHTQSAFETFSTAIGTDLQHDVTLVQEGVKRFSWSGVSTAAAIGSSAAVLAFFQEPIRKYAKILVDKGIAQAKEITPEKLIAAFLEASTAVKNFRPEHQPQVVPAGPDITAPEIGKPLKKLANHMAPDVKLPVEPKEEKPVAPVVKSETMLQRFRRLEEENKAATESLDPQDITKE